MKKTAELPDMEGGRHQPPDEKDTMQMMVSSNGAIATARSGEAEQKNGAATQSAAVDTDAAKAPATYGSTPAVAVSISAQAKAYAIKHGHDPDSLQDGK